MLSFDQLIPTDSAIKSYKAAQAALWTENKQLLDDSLEMARSRFVARMKATNERFEITARECRWYSRDNMYDYRDGNKTINFMHEGDKVEALEATIQLGLGTLVTTLYFVQSDSYHDRDYNRTQGNGRITPVIESKINVATKFDIKDGNYEGFQSLNDNMGIMINQLTRAVEGLNETNLALELHKFFTEFNDSLPEYREQMANLKLMERKRTDKVTANLNAERALLVDYVRDNYEEGWSREDAEQFFSDVLPWGVRMNYEGEFDVNKWNNRHTINSMFDNFEGDVTIQVCKPKRKNSKYLDVVYTIDGNEIRNVVLEREDWYRGLRYACEHIVCSRNFDINPIKEEE